MTFPKRFKGLRFRGLVNASVMFPMAYINNMLQAGIDPDLDTLLTLQVFL